MEERIVNIGPCSAVMLHNHRITINYINISRAISTQITITLMTKLSYSSTHMIVPITKFMRVKASEIFIKDPRNIKKF